MTSSQVTNYPGATIGNWMNSAQTTIKTDGADFQSFMNNSSKNIESGNQVKAEKKETINDTAKPEQVDKSDKIEKNKTSEEVRTETRKPEKDEVDAVKDAINEIKKAIEDLFEVTDEQIDKALEDLGLNLIALLNPENIPEIAVEITGSEDVMSLVTDGELYGKVAEITEKVEAVVENITGRIEINPEEFKQAVTEAQVQIQPENNSENKGPSTEFAAFDAKTKNAETVNGVEKKEEKFTDKISFENERPETAELKNFSVQTKNENNNSGLEEKENSAESVKEPEVKEVPVSFSQNLLTQTQEALNGIDEKVSYSTVDAENIMNQITESIKVSINTENTEISLKLHPETLGNVNIRVAANNEGTLTAQITAQNESVKAVIEAQAMVLRENLEAKGINVEAIEVMVGTHEFEENFSDSQRREEEQSTRKTTVRRINLNDADDEELSEEDNLQKEIMEQNGNTIDYTA